MPILAGFANVSTIIVIIIITYFDFWIKLFVNLGVRMWWAQELNGMPFGSQQTTSRIAGTNFLIVCSTA